MLTYKDLGIQKFILDQLDQITDEAEDDPEYKQLGERPSELLELAAAKLPPNELIYSAALMDGILLGYWVAMVGRGMEKITV